MKKSLLIAVLLTLCSVTASQAVVIHWAATTTDAGYTYDLVRLVYVSDGSRPTTYAQVATTDLIGSASGGGLVTGDTTGVRARTATDNETRSGSGAYYVVLFNTIGDVERAVAASLTYLAWNSGNGEITQSGTNPGTGVFNPTGWAPVPEPGTLALVGLGAAALVIRRRRMRK